MKYVSFNKIYTNKYKETCKLPNIHDKKYEENKIGKKCLKMINLQVVSRDKCNNGIKRENSTGNLSAITGHTLFSRAKL